MTVFMEIPAVDPEFIVYLEEARRVLNKKHGATVDAKKILVSIISHQSFPTHYPISRKATEAATVCVWPCEKKCRVPMGPDPKNSRKVQVCSYVGKSAESLRKHISNLHLSPIEMHGDSPLTQRGERTVYSRFLDLASSVPKINGQIVFDLISVLLGDPIEGKESGKAPIEKKAVKKGSRSTRANGSGVKHPISEGEGEDEGVVDIIKKPKKQRGDIQSLVPSPPTKTRKPAPKLKASKIVSAGRIEKRTTRATTKAARGMATRLRAVNAIKK